MLKLAALVGPTGVGKTELSLKIAPRLEAEIISCDSMQLYRGMDIGTAKATGEERARVKHHLLDCLSPDQPANVARYQEEAREAIRRVHEQGKLPLLVGGTGLYYQALVDDYHFLPMKSRPQTRRKLEEVATTRGLPFLYGQLKNIDPAYAFIISENDRKRIIRALEVYALTGQPFSRFQTRRKDTYHLAVVGLCMEPALLYRRIEQRVEEMLERGLLEEVARLMGQGYDLSCNAMQALGYKQGYYYLTGFTTREHMVAEIKRETRRFAKRQLTWFRKDRRIHWIEITPHCDRDSIAKKIIEYMEGEFNKVYN